MTTDGVIAAIDAAVSDWTVSADAMRSAPDRPAPYRAYRPCPACGAIDHDTSTLAGLRVVACPRLPPSTFSFYLDTGDR